MERKGFAIRFGFIAFALSLCFGIPGQARAANGGCGGRSVIHRKPEDVRDYLIAFWGKLSGGCGKNSVRTKVHVAMEARPIIPTGIALLLPPSPENEIGVRVDLASSLPAMFLNPPAPPAPTGMPAVTPAVPTQVASTRTVVVKQIIIKQKAKRTYEVTINIPRETAVANGIVPGTFPAVYLEGQRKNGEWGSKHKTVATVSQANEDYIGHLFLAHPPAKNASVGIDFENGNSLEISSDMLKGATVETLIPPAPNKKRYKALDAAYKVRTPVVVSIIRFVAPTAFQSGMGFVTMGPMGLVMAPISLVAKLAMNKIAGNQRTLAATEHPSLHVDYLLADQDEKLGAHDTRIKTLELQIQSLQKQMADLLRQTETVTKTTAVKTVQNRGSK